MKYEYEKVKPMVLDGKGNIEGMLSTVKELTGLTIYANDEATLIEIINNPEGYYNNIDEIEKLKQLKEFLDFKGE